MVIAAGVPVMAYFRGYFFAAAAQQLLVSSHDAAVESRHDALREAAIVSERAFFLSNSG